MVQFGMQQLERDPVALPQLHAPAGDSLSFDGGVKATFQSKSHSVRGSG